MLEPFEAKNSFFEQIFIFENLWTPDGKDYNYFFIAFSVLNRIIWHFRTNSKLVHADMESWMTVSPKNNFFKKIFE